LLLAQQIPHVVESFHVALDVEQRCAQLMGDVADETALGGVELHLPLRSCTVMAMPLRLSPLAS
jgi:hypothetical protein